MDVKIAFLHGDLEEEFYMKQLDSSFTVKGKKDLVYKLKNSLYGIKKSLRMWYQNFDTYILGLVLSRKETDHYL